MKAELYSAALSLPKEEEAILEQTAFVSHQKFNEKKWL